MQFTKDEHINSAVEGLIKFHEDKIEELIARIEEIEPEIDIEFVEMEMYSRSIKQHYESIMAIEHWLEDAL